MSQTSAPPDNPPQARRRNIDELDHAILTLSRKLNAQHYQFLVLVREFDERAGWLQWNLPGCSQWLAWRCDLSQSAARERVRIANALKTLPDISRAFAAGYRIRRDQYGSRYFERPDGQAVPACGYHPSDWQDDLSQNDPSILGGEAIVVGASAEALRALEPMAAYRYRTPPAGMTLTPPCCESIRYS